jgi:hypothetical protein
MRASSAGQITSDIDKVYVSEFHHFNWQCAMRLHPAFAPRILGVSRQWQQGRLPLPSRLCRLSRQEGHEGPFQRPAFDPKLFLVRSILLLIHTCHTAGCLHARAGIGMAFKHASRTLLTDVRSVQLSTAKGPKRSALSIFWASLCTPEF